MERLTLWFRPVRWLLGNILKFFGSIIVDVIILMVVMVTAMEISETVLLFIVGREEHDGGRRLLSLELSIIVIAMETLPSYSVGQRWIGRYSVA